MKIGHVALWTNRLEEMRNFYTTYFDGVSNEKYINPLKGFESYFISFEDGIAVEIMSRKDIQKRVSEELLGYCHLSFSLGSKEEVCSLTERLRADGYSVIGEPRITGDGMFESVVLDVDSNRIELCYI